MDMLERRIREVFATLLSKGAKVLERTAGELAHAASELRSDDGRGDPEQPWADTSEDEPRTVTRGAPLRAVPDTPTDEPDDDGGSVITPPAASWTPPAERPEMPEAERSGDIAAAVTMTPPTPEDTETADDRLVELATGTISQIRPQLGDLSPAELRRLKEIELADRGRSTLIAAIDRALMDAPAD
jgi:hypothetical protein